MTRGSNRPAEDGYHPRPDARCRNEDSRRLKAGMPARRVSKGRPGARTASARFRRGPDGPRVPVQRTRASSLAAPAVLGHTCRNLLGARKTSDPHLPYRDRRHGPRAAHARDRAGTPRRDLRPAGGERLRPARRATAAARPMAPTAWACRSATAAWSSTSPTEAARTGGRIPPLARALPAGGEGLLPDLRKLLRRGEAPAAQPDRGDRHGPPRHPQRRRARRCRNGSTARPWSTPPPRAASSP